VSPDGDYPTWCASLTIAFPRPTYAEQEPISAKHLPAPSAGVHAVRVLAVEDVIVPKIFAYRYRDRDDIVEILRAGVPLDHSYLERWAREWEVLDRWQELQVEVGR
jgi:hypothetical protein